MHFSIFSKYLLLTICLTALTACMMSQEQSQPVYTEQQVQQFAAEWQNQQPSIERLAAMEKDLALLIEVLSANSDLTAQPSAFEPQNDVIYHQSEQIQSQQSSSIDSLETIIAANKAAEAGVQLGLYLTPKKVRHQVLNLKRDYPAVLNDLDFRFKTREQKGVTLYGLRAGPFVNYTQATAFCEIAKRMGQTCVTAPFIGEML
ncbi:SPOR domain-containing protein [Pseudoalteromonas sp. S2721]|uniref:SPOR domain-containing protein n=2 Tax=unclassified Pseudoalteromonas TaxID=194690 RepID=UPI00110C1C41|nr:SPOR domain-containing protein [Pseudoalteromonas sp. S2721]|tara:strand:- start:398 stop:1006 length:609 start_codon:yes stop_codon:yes gene_type:complete